MNTKSIIAGKSMAGICCIAETDLFLDSECVALDILLLPWLMKQGGERRDFAEIWKVLDTRTDRMIHKVESMKQRMMKQWRADFVELRRTADTAERSS